MFTLENALDGKKQECPGWKNFEKLISERGMSICDQRVGTLKTAF